MLCVSCVYKFHIRTHTTHLIPASILYVTIVANRVPGVITSMYGMFFSTGNTRFMIFWPRSPTGRTNRLAFIRFSSNNPFMLSTLRAFFPYTWIPEIARATNWIPSSCSLHHITQFVTDRTIFMDCHIILVAISAKWFTLFCPFGYISDITAEKTWYMLRHISPVAYFTQNQSRFTISMHFFACLVTQFTYTFISHDTLLLAARLPCVERIHA